ncbi:MAG: RNA-directed DNA polymerase [Treponema sp.]|nr:RNA-directed DNA polymerase [Treponema sp.]
MKRAKSLFDKITSHENFRLAWLKARKGKTSKKAVKNFSRNLNEKLMELQKRVLCEKPEFSGYVQFKISDPKERIISVVPFADRVIHHAIINVLEDVFERQMVFHTYACRKRKGTHAAAMYAFRKAKTSSFFLKLDVRKYFDSIDHGVLKKQLSRIIKDGRCLSLLFSVIDSYSSAQGGGRGLPIGNLTSQFFANLYLSPLDHLVLEKLHPIGYVRYMDDMILFSDSVNVLRAQLAVITEFCRAELGLSLKPAVFGRTSQGIPFLGWRITNGRIFLLKKTRRRMRATMKKIKDEYAKGKITRCKCAERIRAVYAARDIEPHLSQHGLGTPQDPMSDCPLGLGRNRAVTSSGTK